MSNETVHATVDQVVSYLRRNRWIIHERTKRCIRWEPPNRGFLGAIVVLPRHGTHPNPSMMVEQAARDIARHEKRESSAVLADIAKEPVE